MFLNKRCFINTEAHEFGFLLAPKNVSLWADMPNDDYKRTIKNFKLYCKKYYPDEAIASKAIEQFLQYLNDASQDEDENNKIHSIHYWSIYGKKYGLVK